MKKDFNIQEKLIEIEDKIEFLESESSKSKNFLKKLVSQVNEIYDTIKELKVVDIEYESEMNIIESSNNVDSDSLFKKVASIEKNKKNLEELEKELESIEDEITFSVVGEA